MQKLYLLKKTVAFAFSAHIRTMVSYFELLVSIRTEYGNICRVRNLPSVCGELKFPCDIPPSLRIGKELDKSRSSFSSYIASTFNFLYLLPDPIYRY